jgi:hypothetical protein
MKGHQMHKTLIAVVLAGAMIGPALAVTAGPPKLSCDELIRNGWDRMPDVADYIHTLRGSDRLGFGSECHLGSLVFAQCFAESRRQTVREAIAALIWKATHGKRLPDTPACGA